MKKIVVIGSLNMDVVIQTPRMPEKGETISGAGVSYIPGGKGANQAFSAAKLGGRVSMIGAVGQDSAGDALIRNLEKVGVDVSGIECCPDVPTGQAFITVDQNGDNSIVLVAGANQAVTKELVDRHENLIREADLVLLQLEIPLESVEYAKEIAAALGKRALLDPAPAVSGLPSSFWKGVSCIKPNETEIGILTGRACDTEEELRASAQELRSLGAEQVLISLGEKGCLFVGENTEELFAAQKVKAVDTTAAGDCFMGALARMLSEDASMQEAIAFAQKAAAVSVTRKGAQTSMPSMEEVLGETKEP